MNKIFTSLSFVTALAMQNCKDKEVAPSADQWTTYEISLTSYHIYSNAYTEVDVWAEFRNGKGAMIIRPGFWDGGQHWKIRFAPPDNNSEWKWTTYASVDDGGLTGKSGVVRSSPYTGSNRLLQHGLLQMSAGTRNVVHADGTPFLVVGDTPWAIPFRAKPDQVEKYAADRQKKGFNVALLMSLQPDRYAEGPESRDSIGGFARAFQDLPDGHLNLMQPEYFQYLDRLIQVLVDHEIVPVYQPVFHGFGWKGKTVLGTTADPHEYARYCRYLVARYGSMPAFWLVGGDGNGLDPGVKPGGEEIEKWDAYQQPTGIHYNPCDDYLASWAQNDSTKCFHYFRSHQAEPWLDFQWAQTGHSGEHLPYKLERMHNEKPVKAVLNGEPTYEGMGGGQLGLGWWQAEEAWTNLMHGGTMGVVYGAATLWQWKLTSDEPGWDTWTDQNKSWREAMEMEGSTFVGNVGKAFRNFDFTDMEMRWDLAEGNHPTLAREGRFYVTYLPDGGEVTFKSLPDNLDQYWFDPAEGDFVRQEKAGNLLTFRAPDGKPWVLFLVKDKNH